MRFLLVLCVLSGAAHAASSSTNCQPGRDCNVATLRAQNAILSKASVTPSATSALQNTQTTAALTLYVDSTGNDANACTATGTSACLTIQGAFDKIPANERHPVTVSIGAGNFAGAVLAGKTVQPARGGQANYIDVVGTLATETGLAASTDGGVAQTSGTLTAFTAASTSIPALFTDSTAGWATDDLKGRLIEITSGTGVTATSIYVIVSNTANTLSAQTLTTATAAAGSGYAIRKWGTVITTAVTVDTGNPWGLVNYSAAGLRVSGVLADGAQGNGLVIEKLAFNIAATRAIEIDTAGRAYLRWVKVDDTSAAPAIWLRGAGAQFVQSYAKSSGSGTSLIAGNGTTTAVGWTVSQSFIDGGATGVSAGSSGTISSSLITNQTTAAISLGTGNGGTLQMTNSKVTGAAAGLAILTSTAGGGYASFGITNSDFSSNTTAFSLLGRGVLGVLGTVTGSANTTAVNLSKGGSLQVGSGTTLTGTSEIVLDGAAAQTFAAMRAATPKHLKDSNYFTVIYE